MNQGIKDLHRLTERGRDENLILVIGTAVARPALANVMTTSPGTGKPAGDHDILWDDVSLSFENRSDQIDCSQQPGFTCRVMSHVAHLGIFDRLKV